MHFEVAAVVRSLIQTSATRTSRLAAEDLEGTEH